MMLQLREFDVIYFSKLCEFGRGILHHLDISLTADLRFVKMQSPLMFVGLSIKKTSTD